MIMLLIFCYKFTGKYVSLNSCGEWVKYQCGSVFALSLVLDNLFATIFQIYSVYVIKVYFRHLRIDEKLGFQQLGEGVGKRAALCTIDGNVHCFSLHAVYMQNLKTYYMSTLYLLYIYGLIYISNILFM